MVKSWPGHMEDETRRQRPQHADEAGQQDGRLQQPDAEAGRQVGEMVRILVQALVGIDADGAGIGQPECAPRPHPFADQVARQPFAQSEMQRLADPGLRDIEHQQPAGDLGEHHQLMHERRQVAPRQRVVERCVPAVEHHLAEGGRQDDRQHAAGQREQGAAQRRAHEGPPHHRQLVAKASRRVGVWASALPFVGSAMGRFSWLLAMAG